MDRKSEECSTEKKLRGEAMWAITILLLFYFGSRAVGGTILVLVDFDKPEQDRKTPLRSGASLAAAAGKDKMLTCLSENLHRMAS